MQKPKINREYWPTKEWKVSSDNNKDTVNRVNTLISSKYKSVNGVLVLKNGYVLSESYYNGYNENDTHNIASVTKSILSALIGISIDKGYIQGVEQKVYEFFHEYSVSPKDFIKRSITIREILTMTAPIASRTIGKMWEPLDRLRRQPDWIKYIFGILGKGLKGKFQYSTAGAHLLSAILTKSTGLSACEFANLHLFKLTGMSNIEDKNMDSYLLDDVFGKNVSGWIKDPQGYSTGGWGLTLSVRDMARFGLLYLNEGVWNGKQVVSKSWIEESLTMNSNNYGYMWWLRESNGINSYAALGSGGNIICCIPDKGIVISVVAKVTAKSFDPLKLIDEICNEI